MSRFVTIHYDPEKWVELNKRPNRKKLVTITDGQSESTNTSRNSVDLTPSKMVTFKFGSRAKSREVSTSPTKRISSPTLAALRNLHKNGNNINTVNRSRSASPPVEFQRSETPNIDDSLTAMSMYQNFVMEQKTEQEVLEADWFDDLKRVAQRLHFLREAYKIVQSVHRKKLEVKQSSTPEAENEAGEVVGNLVVEEEEGVTTPAGIDVEEEESSRRRESVGDHLSLDLLNVPGITISPLVSEADQDEEDITSSQPGTSPIKQSGGENDSTGDNIMLSGRRRNFIGSNENSIYKKENDNLDLDVGSLQDNDNDSIDGGNSSSNFETPMEHISGMY
ncbi:hypothetical protein CLIB1423_02S07976 [[Candida] railenensis]|uniref:Uncharacterized protein n=1 Tax=[Candida] railenensis TaxID=45579 RepID=A0A9P0VWG6_9ASCO|nr:hypothetical protein CLIB1423_02S07976 [[Candida] railenensis]